MSGLGEQTDVATGLRHVCYSPEPAIGADRE
jgi:hypothetical protein